MPAANFQSVNADGAFVTYASPPTFDPVSSPEYFTVTRSGFLNGSPVSVVEDLICMDIIRQAYPAQASLTSDQVAISGFVYAGETISGSPVNNSTRAYPKPQAMWLNHDKDHATSSLYTLRLAVSHAYARNGRPVDSVEFIISDGTTTVTQLVTSMDVIAYSATGLSVPHFAADMDLSTLTQGVMLTVDAIINPWVGDAFQISVDADAYPSPNLTTFQVLNDRTGGYGTSYATVNLTTGNDGTGVASTSIATADASPFLTTAAAVAAITAYNAANFGRSSDAGGGHVRVVEGVHTLNTGFKSAGASVDIPLVIEAADPTKQTTTVLQDKNATLTNGTPTMLKIKGITLRKVGGSVTFIDSGASSAGRLIVEDCIWDLNGKSFYGAWVYRVGIFWQINCSGSAAQSQAFSTVYKAVNLIGCALGMGDAVFHSVGSTGSRLDAKGASGSMPASAGLFLGWNRFFATSGSNRLIGVDVPQGSRGLGINGNIVEAAGTHNAPAIQIAADNNAMAVENAVIKFNTVVGDRSNILYLDASTNAAKSGYVSDNVLAELNIKSDVFATNGALIGNWPARYKVGWRGNYAYAGASNGSSYSPTSWLGEIPSLGEVIFGTPNFTDDQSHDGGNAGGGDYAPTAGTSIPQIPAGKAAYPYDLLGQAIADDGTARAGAVQMLSGPTTITGDGAADASVTVSGSGSVAVSGDGTAQAEASAVGAGSVATSGDGVADVFADAAGAGQVAVLGAGQADVGAAVSGAGDVAISGDGSAQSEVAASGDGDLAIDGDGTAEATVTATGTGSAGGEITGDGVAQVDAAATGSGSIEVSGAGAAAAGASAVGAGASAIEGAGLAAVAVSEAGAGQVGIEGAGSATVSVAAVGQGTAGGASVTLPFALPGQHTKAIRLTKSITGVRKI